jgi:ech hydrogenase subunit A
MVKAGVYLVIRLAPAFQGTYLSTIIAIFGAFVFLVTSILAISQSEGKRVLAYSTIGNLGLIILCAGINTPLAITAAIMLIMFHAISKGLLFLCAGTIEHHIWSRNIEDMQGLVGRLPLLTAITIAGMISMLVAPFGVLVSKWAAIQAAPEASPLIWSTLVLILLVAGSGATTVFWVKWMGRLLSQVPTPQSPKMESFIPLYHGILLLFIVVAFAVSCLIAPAYNQLVAPALQAWGYAAAFSTADWFLRSTVGVFAAWPLFIVVAAALVIPLLLVRMKREEVRPSYMCGENVEYEMAEFRSLADERTGLETGGFYLGSILGERNLNRFVNPIALLILFILFALVGA